MKGFRTEGEPVTNSTKELLILVNYLLLKCLLTTRSNIFQLSFNRKLEKLVKDLEEQLGYELFSDQ